MMRTMMPSVTEETIIHGGSYPFVGTDVDIDDDRGVDKMLVMVFKMLTMMRSSTCGETRVGAGSCPPLLAAHTHTAQWLADRRPTTSEIKGFLSKADLAFLSFWYFSHFVIFLF